MDTYWSTYLAGDLETWAGFLTDDYKNIGGTEEEIWNSKQEILSYSEAMLQQVVGLAELRNKRIEVFSLEPYVLAHEFTDMYIKTENEWTFYGKFRLSTILKPHNNSWLVVHQHGSYPDSKTEQGEAFAFDKITTENRELRDAIQRRTIELENKNYELKIEAALERVRTVAMAMKRPEDMLEVCRTISEQLEQLNVKDIRNVQTIIIYENKKVYVNYEYYSRHNKELITEVNYLLHPAQHEMVLQMQKGPEEFFSKSMTGDEVQKWYAYQKTTTQYLDSYLETANSVNWYFYSIGPVALGLSTYAPLEEEAILLFKRFRNVFALSYRRYLDIEEAEGRAREAQIELALERVRERAMAMQKPEELNALVGTLFTELTNLDLVLTRCIIMIHDPITNDASWLMANSEDPGDPMNFLVRYHEYPPNLAYLKAWRERIPRWEYILEGTTKTDWDDYIFSETELSLLPDFVIAGMRAPTRVYLNASFANFGNLTLASLEPLSDEHFNILIRFANAFDLTYTRYNDLKKAEAQAREVEIELGLERVRAKTLAMHQSKDLLEVIPTLGEQFKLLGFKIHSINVNTTYREKDWHLWLYNPGHSIYPEPIHIPYFDHPYFNRTIENLAKGNDFLTCVFSKQEKDQFLDYIYQNTIARNVSDERKQFTYDAPGFAWSVAYSENTALTIANYDAEPYSEEEDAILKRFATVFEQTYNRFLDLQKAEAHAREVQIQLALERVRARTMAMQKSSELAEASSLLFQQLRLLQVDTYSSGFTIWDNENQNLVSWMCNADGSMNPPFIMPISGNAWHQQQYESWKNGEEFIVKEMVGEEMQLHFKYLRSYPLLDIAFNTSVAAGHSMPERQVHNVVNFSYGNLLFITLDPCPEAHTIFKRFGKVFEQTYTRFLDLQTAEAQAREATIQASLEKVRGKAMAMQNSNDLSVTASMVFTELRKLGINPIRCGVGLLTKESRKAQLYSATSTAGGDSLSLVGWVMLTGHPVLEHIYDSWLKNEEYYPCLVGEELQSYYEHLLAGLSVPIPDWKTSQKQYGHFPTFSVGCLYAWSEVPYDEAELNILRRFATIIDLTFRRYLELQQAEANAGKALKQAALDRVRADIASMRSTADLDRITPLIWNELTIIGVPFIRCGVFLMDEEKQQVQTHLATPDGKAIAAFTLSYHAPGEIREIVAHWQRKQVYRQHWNEEQFIAFATNLLNEGAISTGEKYLTENRPTDLYLHFIPFSQGMLYAGNTASLSDEALQLMKEVAEAFSTAYARYEDFNKLEEAKIQVDAALIELKATQAQLIQSEKMASLGELTAGIAHEIQNPLNFVNNFSEVNEELIAELQEELKAGNNTDVLSLATALDDNLKKILHHGKRADSIVKGMLQHSRTDTGKKEYTDINALADEYLRLSYHGLRAKHKTFTAIFETHFDPALKPIEIVPQEIGRVLLNLFNNAFYAVNEKKKTAEAGYDPTVSVSTQASEKQVIIKVKDNGHGIPANAIDKIFQPFFTTKPTGEGTGLGLSLSYDIITKGHGGEMTVATKEGIGTEFTILIPVKQTI
jgi:signal transduction histidine kinase